MKKIRLSETELTNIIKRVINEQDSNYVKDQCVSLILTHLLNYVDDAVNDAKKVVSTTGGKFPQGNPPTEEDWREADLKIIRSIGNLK